MITLKADNITKNYFKKSALSGVSIQLEQGRIVGLLGPNGSGKTTFLKLATGLVRPTSGSITVCDREIGYKSKELVALLQTAISCTTG